MLRSISTSTLSGRLREKIRAVADAGYDGIEIFENDILYSQLSISQIRELTIQCGLDIVALQPLRDFEGLPGARRQHAFDRAVRKLDVAAELGTLRLLVCSSVHLDALDDPRRAADDLAELAELAADRGVEIGYQALAWGRHVRNVSQAWNIVQMADHPSLGIVLNSFHLFVRGNPLQCLDPIPVEKITLVQVADAPDIPMDVSKLSRHYRCYPGQGDFPVEAFLARLNAKKYSGYVSQEIFSDEFRAAAPGQVAMDGYRSLSWLKAAAAGERFSENHEAHSVEFIEIATDASQRPYIVSLLKDLGFVHSHRHKSKSVALYQQGDINLIVNAEIDSFANNYFQQHGLSVCAIGLGVNHPEALVERLRKRQYTIVKSENSPDEMDIPAVLGIGESLIYLCPLGQNGQRFIDIDFEPIEGALTTKTALQCVDHIGQVVEHSEFLSSLLFYRDALGFEPESQFDLHDPRGMMLSRTVTSRDKSVRIPINTSQSKRSSSGRFRERYSGSGTQQLAFSCDDIFDFSKTLNPSKVLPIPDNYYDDIDSRLQMPAEQLAKMRQYNILYDEDESGTFFHLYLREINGLFVEVLQRTGYQQFGEVNAAVRLASQAREDGVIRTSVATNVAEVARSDYQPLQPTQFITSLSQDGANNHFSTVANNWFKNHAVAAQWNAIQLNELGIEAAFTLLKNSDNNCGYYIDESLQKSALPHVDVMLGAAQRCQSINVVACREDGQLVGERLDGVAIVAALRQQLSFDISGSTVSICGCNDLAEALSDALLAVGVAQLHIVDHPLSQACTLVDKLSQNHAGITISTSQDALPNSQLLLNCHEDQPHSKDLLEPLLATTLICDLAGSLGVSGFIQQADLAGFNTLNSDHIRQLVFPYYLKFFGFFHGNNPRFIH